MSLSLFACLAVIDLLSRLFWLERSLWTCNTGAFWGLALPPMLLYTLLAGLLGYIAWLFGKAEGEKRLWLGLVLMGGTVNALDRLFHGCVLDYFAWPFGLSVFLPNFNLADMILLLGVLGWFTSSWRWKASSVIDKMK